MFKKLALALLAISIGVSHASAQNEAKNELGLLLGATFTPALNISNQTGKVSFGSGLTFQATYAHRLVALPGAAVYFEVPFAAAPNIDISTSNSSVPASYASLFITPGLRLKLHPNAKVAPWLALGGGYARFHESAELQNGSPNPGRIGANRGAVEFGGGIDFRTPIKVLFPIKLRVEIRDFYSGQPNYNLAVAAGFQHNLLFSGGLAVSF